MKANLPQLLAALVIVAPGCIGSIRETTTARTATEMLLVSTAAERALVEYDVAHLSGKRVFVDHQYFESIDKPFVLSALRDHLAEGGVTLMDKVKGEEGEGPEANAELVLELRNASLGIWDGDFVLGIPQLPVSSGYGLPPVLLPPLYAFRRFSQQGWAKFEFWTYDPQTMAHIHRSGPLWGSAYYNQWWWFGIGPFDGSNDIYPEWDMPEYVAGTTEREVDD